MYQSGRGVLISLLILTGLALTASVSLAYYKLRDHMSLQNLEAEKTRLATLSLEQKFRHYDANYQTASQRMASLENKLSQLPGLDTDRADHYLLLSETEYLLQSAEWQLRLFRNHKAAIYALSRSLIRLQELNLADLNSTQLAIQRAIALLRTTPPLAIEDILQFSLELQDAILELPPVSDSNDPRLTKLLVDARDETENTPEQESDSTSQAEVSLEWYEKILHQFVQIKKLTLADDLGTETNRKSVLWENLLIQINHLQLATLGANQTAYQNAIQKITKFIELGWSLSTEEKTRVMELLRTMNQQVVSVPPIELEQIRLEVVSALNARHFVKPQLLPKPEIRDKSSKQL